MFGHIINFNFKAKGETYQTSIGGFCSILIYIAMTLYVFWHLKMLILMENSTLSTQGTYLDLMNEDVVKLKSNNITLFHTLYNLKGGAKPLYLD